MSFSDCFHCQGRTLFIRREAGLPFGEISPQSRSTLLISGQPWSGHWPSPFYWRWAGLASFVNFFAPILDCLCFINSLIHLLLDLFIHSIIQSFIQYLSHRPTSRFWEYSRGEKMITISALLGKIIPKAWAEFCQWFPVLWRVGSLALSFSLAELWNI